MSLNKHSYQRNGCNTIVQGLNFVLKINQKGVAIIAKISNIKNIKTLKNHFKKNSPKKNCNRFVPPPGFAICLFSIQVVIQI